MGIPFRIGLKDSAILALTKGRYWKGFSAHLVHLAPKAASSALGVGLAVVVARHLPEILPRLSNPVLDAPWLLASYLAARGGTPVAPAFAGVLVLCLLQFVLAVLVSAGILAATVFIFRPLDAGLRDWYRLNRGRNPGSMRTVFGSFRKERYGLAVRTSILRLLRLSPAFLPGAAIAAGAALYVALRYAVDAAWIRGGPDLPADTFAGLAFPVLLAVFIALVGFVPAWIRDYAYRLVPWILAALPGLSPREVIRLSECMTRGRRLDLFLLDLSFAGWAITSLLTCGTGLLFIAPYYEAVQAETCARLAEEAEAAGYLVRRARSSRTDPEASHTGFL